MKKAFIAMTLIATLGSTVYADSNIKKTYTIDVTPPASKSTPVKTDTVKEPEKPVSDDVPVTIMQNPYPKEPVVISKSKPAYATDENQSRGYITDNRMQNGDYVDPTKQNLEFITFQTKSGKTLHLIIDRANPKGEVKLVTEVSELDLLNLIEKDEKEKLDKSNKKAVSTVEEIDKQLKELEAKDKLESKDVQKTKETPPVKAEKKSFIQENLYLILGVIAVFVFMLFKKFLEKKDKFVDEEALSDKEHSDEENIEELINNKDNLLAEMDKELIDEFEENDLGNN